MITQERLEQELSSDDTLHLQLSSRNTIVLDLGAESSDDHAILKMQKLRFFHTWTFFYFYSAEHKFLKRLLKGKFTFSQPLFGTTLTSLYNPKNTQ